MLDDVCFADLVRRIREGDEQAARELVRDYEPVVRREVRMRLQDQRLRRLFDSGDICQSVMAAFFEGAAAGEFDVQHPAQLVSLLVAMAQKQVASKARWHSRKRRDHRKTSTGDRQFAVIPGDDETPSQTFSYRELIERAQDLLSEEERSLIEFRNDGCGWEEIANRLGGTAQGRRMQFSRAVERTMRDLGLDEEFA